MRRREFVMVAGGAAIIWPLAARAQQKAMPVIGYLNAAAPGDSADLVGAFRQGLSEAAFVEGRDVAVEYRWAEGHYERLPLLAADVVHRQVQVIAATSTPVALAAKAATGTIPIVFTIGGDPVKVGLVSNLSRPDGNLTGVTRYNVELGPKRLEFLHDVVPGAKTLGLLVNPTNPNTETLSTDVGVAAGRLGIEIHVAKAANEGELDAAFEILHQLRVGAVVIGNDPFFNSRSGQLAELTGIMAQRIKEGTEIRAAGQ
jgi:putative ABC transport system substrate-binding protein